jgi:ribosomal protein L39E
VRAREVMAWAEYALRLLFFALVPFGVVLLAMLVPMTAAIINMILALGVFFSSEMLLEVADKRPWLRRVLRRQLAFEAYYREHPPRPFLYYVFYPLMMPYWLFVREARREFLIFKSYTIVTAAVISVLGVYRYFWVYQPELGFRHFVVAFAIGSVLETLAVVTLIMPMTTSVVTLHQKRQHWRLVALLAVGLVSAGVAAVVMAKRHRAFPSLETRQRVVARTAAVPTSARESMHHAAEAAWAVRRAGKGPEAHDPWERDTDGTVIGAPLDKAREVLGSFYRHDEAVAFELWTTAKKERPGLMVLFAEGSKKGTPVWIAMRRDGTVIDKLADVPKPARHAMRSAGEF